MKFTLSWLQEYLKTEFNLTQICQKLNDIGLEVENIEEPAKHLAMFSVAKIIEAVPHPDSNKLKICQVAVGQDVNPQILQIICGAKNARSNLKVAYAPIGSIVPQNEMKIKQAKIAGVESFGMLCSALELGLNNQENDEGIIEIDDSFPIGSKISQVFGLNDAIIEINITPNRGDCLGVFGIARDLAAAGIGTIKSPKIKTIQSDEAFPFKIKVESNDCPYFSAAYIKNVNNQSSPKWLKTRLESIGCKPTSLVVDVVNYTMFCLGQPLHCYDADYLSENLLVKNATPAQQFKSLAGNNYQLNGGELVVENDQEIVALAGIIGGEKTAVSLKTKNILLESAWFLPQNIAQTGRSLNIISEARFRFERGVDLQNVSSALMMASNLILEICGDEKTSVSLVEFGSNLVKKNQISLDLRQVKAITGIEIDHILVKQILTNLGFELKEINQNLIEVVVPTHRSDITIYQDLVEEIIRIYGLNQIVSQPLKFDLTKQNQSACVSKLDAVVNKLANSGFRETINYSFIDENLANLFAAFNPQLKLQNPIAKQMSQMRPTLLVGLLQNVAKNQNRGFENLSIFEIGRIFLDTQPNKQRNVIAALRIGKNKEQDQFADQRNFDIFDIKQDLFSCLEVLNISPNSTQLSNKAPNYYHPHRSKAVAIGRNVIAYFGELHPLITKNFAIQSRVNVFELLIEDIPPELLNSNKNSHKKVFNVSDLPTVKRDFAFIVDRNIEVGEILKKVANFDKSLINEVNLFDVYQDQKLGDNKQSIAFSIKIQPIEKTLNSEEIEAISQKIIKMVENDFAATLRCEI